MGDNEVELYSYNNMLGGTDDETEGDDQPPMKKAATDVADSEISSSFHQTNMPQRHQAKMRSQQNVHSQEDFARRQHMKQAHSNNEYFHILGPGPRDLQPPPQHHHQSNGIML
jgi:hypothetical protein